MKADGATQLISFNSFLYLGLSVHSWSTAQICPFIEVHQTQCEKSALANQFTDENVAVFF